MAVSGPHQSLKGENIVGMQDPLLLLDAAGCCFQCAHTWSAWPLCNNSWAMGCSTNSLSDMTSGLSYGSSGGNRLLPSAAVSTHSDRPSVRLWNHRVPSGWRTSAQPVGEMGWDFA